MDLTPDPARLKVVLATPADVAHREQQLRETIAEIARECAHCGGDVQPDTLRATVHRVAALAGAPLPEPVQQAWHAHEPLPGAALPAEAAQRGQEAAPAAAPPWHVVDLPPAQMHDLMADTLEVALPRLALPGPADPLPGSDAEWRQETVRLQRLALQQAAEIEEAHLAWREAMEQAMAHRHEAAQDEAWKRHEGSVDAAHAARRSNPRDMALQILAGLPPEWPLQRRHHVMREQLELLLQYPDEPGAALPPAPPAWQPPAEQAPLPLPGDGKLPSEPALPPAPVSAPPQPPQAGGVDRITAERFATLRGFGYFNASQGPAAAAGWQEMLDMGATLVRCWYIAEWTGSRYAVSTQQIRSMQDAVRSAAAHGLTPVLCLDMQDPDMPWGSKARFASFVDLWATLARLHADQPAAVFEPLNEPRPREGKLGGDAYTPEQHAETALAWRELALATVGAIRAIDPHRLCIVQMGLGADPHQFVQQAPLPLPEIVYSAHFYLPHAYTHHAVPESVRGAEQPPPRPMVPADRALVQDHLDALARWSQQHLLPVFVGEFSAHNTQPDAAEYVELVVDWCNRHGWPWSYHEWRQWPGWQPTQQTQQVLRKALAG